MATRQRHFFATKADLLPVLEQAERKRPLKYTRTGLFASRDLTVFGRGQDIQTLDLPSPHANAICGYNYLVTDAQEKVVIRECPQVAGGVRYAVDQGFNPRSICLLHGGLFAPDILLYGRIGTVSDEDTIAKEIYRSFYTAIGKHFLRVKAFFVGPQALVLLRSGARLTIGADSPRDTALTEN